MFVVKIARRLRNWIAPSLAHRLEVVRSNRISVAGSKIQIDYSNDELAMKLVVDGNVIPVDRLQSLVYEKRAGEIGILTLRYIDNRL